MVIYRIIFFWNCELNVAGSEQQGRRDGGGFEQPAERMVQKRQEGSNI
jgi:hypothetical protein